MLDRVALGIKFFLQKLYALVIPEKLPRSFTVFNLKGNCFASRYENEKEKRKIVAALNQLISVSDESKKKVNSEKRMASSM